MLKTAATAQNSHTCKVLGSGVDYLINEKNIFFRQIFPQFFIKKHIFFEESVNVCGSF